MIMINKTSLNQYLLRVEKKKNYSHVKNKISQEIE